MSVDKTKATSLLKEASYLLHNFDDLIEEEELSKEAEETIVTSEAYIDLDELSKLAGVDND